MNFRNGSKTPVSGLKEAYHLKLCGKKRKGSESSVNYCGDFHWQFFGNIIKKKKAVPEVRDNLFSLTFLTALFNSHCRGRSRVSSQIICLTRQDYHSSFFFLSLSGYSFARESF